jgi:hypothetical protein
VLAPPGGGALRVLRHAIGDPVQEAGQRLLFVDGAGLLGQQEEGSLEGVFGVLEGLELPAANAEDQWAVPPDEGGEGPLVVSGEEVLEQFVIAAVWVRLGGEALDVMDDTPQRCIGHERLSRSFLPCIVLDRTISPPF